MIPVVIPLIKQHDNTELKFALRSIDKFMTGHEVVLVGEEIPEWTTGVAQIKVKDIPNQKQLSIKKKIIAALRIYDEIFFSNDDIYLLQKTDPATYPFYYLRSLRHSGESGTKILIDRLKELNKQVKHFDVHFPILYKKEFINIAEQFPAETIIKSMYCNYLDIEGTEITDCKIMRNMSPEMIRTWIKDKPCFSTGVHSTKEATKVLQELFPNKSKFEI